jgi:hypoxanthine phosphoribosyltransferase
MNKIFLPYTTVRNNAIKMAHRIYNEGFVPDVIYVPLRGGAYLGNIISEYFKIVQKGKRPVFYAAVVARSYTDVRENSNVIVDGWTYDPKYLRTGDKILFIDDIFDSGKTINYLVNIILSEGIKREDIKIAVHDYKKFTFKDKNMAIHPDYYCRKHIINSPEEDIWIHYMSHELQGLTKEELSEHYYKDDPELKEALSILEN